LKDIISNKASIYQFENQHGTQIVTIKIIKKMGGKGKGVLELLWEGICFFKI
jgi:hypothetical protein